MSNRKNRIKAGPAPGLNSIPQPGAIRDPFLTFSFKYFDCRTNGKFTFSGIQITYAENLVERLKALSGWTVNQFVTQRCRTTRNHQIAFADTSEPSGFSHVNQQLWGEKCWQFSISANEHGRIHGFLIQNVFFVVWVDPQHKLYP